LVLYSFVTPKVPLTFQLCFFASLPRQYFRIYSCSIITDFCACATVLTWTCRVEHSGDSFNSRPSTSFSR
jgi:hypothetical protein